MSDLLKSFAAKYIWWKTPDDALRYPNRILAQVMNLGTHDDLHLLVESVDRLTLQKVILEVEAGWFSPHSWHFWHYKLGLAEPGQVPSLPEKVLV